MDEQFIDFTIGFIQSTHRTTSDVSTLDNLMGQEVKTRTCPDRCVPIARISRHVPMSVVDNPFRTYHSKPPEPSHEPRTTGRARLFSIHGTTPSPHLYLLPAIHYRKGQANGAWVIPRKSWREHFAIFGTTMLLSIFGNMRIWETDAVTKVTVNVLSMKCSRFPRSFQSPQ